MGRETESKTQTLHGVCAVTTRLRTADSEANCFAHDTIAGYPCAQAVPIKSSPLITQYLSVKQKVPDAILFFRLGDFYEMFFEDAETGARVLDIQLTSRSKDGVPLCGVPYHSAQPYIAKLLKAGFKVAICEQNAPEPAATGAQ